MKLGIFGTGTVGRTLGSKIVRLGHDVKMGSRQPNNETAAGWVKTTGEGASHGTFADAAAHGELLFNCTAGAGSLAALASAGAQALSGKILVDVANPLDFSKGMPPQLSIFNDDSLGERIQRTFPDTRVVKALNTVNAPVMVDPSRVPGQHDVFLCGNDEAAKHKVHEILRDWLGWKNIVDMGDISMARGTESYLLLWVRLWQCLGTADFNIHITKR